ncbi:MAG: amidinotransferase [Planctomycetia bacterium]|nr:amidinotransferase [Planctomycetia bacterium]
MPATVPHILMCPPDYYGIEYEINPWMSRGRQVDRPQAIEQWRALKRLLEKCGARVSLLPPVDGLPDLVFTANAAMIYQHTAVLANFRHQQRQGETPHARAWLQGAGFDVVLAPTGTCFEGAGDALFCGETLFAGYRIRSDARGMQQVGQLIGTRVIPLELVDPYFYHLDTCFCPLSATQAIWHPAAFDTYARQALAAHVEQLIEVSEDEARSFACNAVVVGRNVLTNTGCPGLHAALTDLGYTTQATPLAEFVKAGGSAKCLTLRLDGEEAAAWK